MELRSCSSLHFIQAIKSGLVIKTCNIDPLGRPGLVFKKLKDIYEAAESEDLDTSATLKRSGSYKNLALHFDGVKIESPGMPLVERKTRERNHGDNAKDSDSDDLNFGKLTLKQLKERCKTKKRKASNVAWLSPKPECTHLEPEEDECDLMEPLSSLKSKLSKSPKTKKKCKGRNVSSSSKIVLSIKSEQILGNEDSLQSTNDYPASVTVKAEDPGPEYAESQITSCVMDDSSSCIEGMGLCGVESGEVHKAYNCESENGEPISFTEQCGSCIVNSLSYDHLEPVEHASLPSPIHGETMEVDNQEKTEQESPVLHVPQYKEGYLKHQSSPESFKEIVSPAKDQWSDTCNIFRSCGEPEVQVSSVIIDNGPCRRGGLMEDLPLNVDNCSLSSPFSNCISSLNSYPHLTSYNNLVPQDDSPLPEEKQPSVFTIADAARNCDNNFVVAGDDSPTNKDTQSLSFHGADAARSCDNNFVVAGDDSPTNKDTQSLSSHGADAARSCENNFVVAGDDSPTNEDTQSLSSHGADAARSCDNNFVVAGDDSPTNEDTQSLSSHGADAARSCDNNFVVVGDDSPTRSCDNNFAVAGDDSPTNEDTKSLSSYGADAAKNFSSGTHHSCDVLYDLSTSGVWQPPERLPSTRKVISPTSQERLCLAMKSVEMFDETDHYTCKGKLFGKQNNGKASPKDIGGAELSMSPKEHAQVVRTKACIMPKEILKKPKNFKKGSPPKGCLEGPHLSRSFPRLSTGCTSIEGCSESAIAFSQRQMHDIESLATKLMNELKSVKEVVEEKLLFEAYRSTSLKNDADEVKKVIKNATKVEETSRRWLSMMARDCNRFCKIMRLTENDITASENPIQREKKITFADEAGGALCQVKLFENGMASIEPKSETHELQAE